MFYSIHKKLVLTVYFIFYYFTLFSFFFSHRLLSQYKAVFFTHNRDLTELALIATGIPAFMIAQPWTYIVADSLMFIVPVFLLIFYIKQKAFSRITGFLFLALLLAYFLLQDIFTQLHSQMFIGFFIIAFTFITTTPQQFYNALKLGRYFFLYSFVSAAIWKISRGTLLNTEQLSTILVFQHGDLLTGNCSNNLCRLYFYLINHPAISFMLYIGAIIIESCFIIGFFTRKWDNVLLSLAIIFFTFDHLIMRIPFWPVMALGVSLLIKEHYGVNCPFYIKKKKNF